MEKYYKLLSGVVATGLAGAIMASNYSPSVNKVHKYYLVDKDAVNIEYDASDGAYGIYELVNSEIKDINMGGNNSIDKYNTYSFREVNNKSVFKINVIKNRARRVLDDYSNYRYINKYEEVYLLNTYYEQYNNIVSSTETDISKEEYNSLSVNLDNNLNGMVLLNNYYSDKEIDNIISGKYSSDYYLTQIYNLCSDSYRNSYKNI